MVSTVLQSAQSFLRWGAESAYFLSKRLRYYACTFVDAAENREYQVFGKLKAFSNKRALSDSDKVRFKETMAKVTQQFNDSLIERHAFRMNSKENWEKFCSIKNPEERALVRLHELVEILSLKWECGKGFDEPVGRDFWFAHTRAISIENHHLILRAEEMGIKLTHRALAYIRIVDEYNLYNRTYISSEMWIDDAVACLTKNKDQLPPISEMKEYVCFMADSGVLSHSKKDICNMVWSRYFFTILHKRALYRSDVKLLLLILHYFVRCGYFEHRDSEKLLIATHKALDELEPHARTNIVDRFSNLMKRIDRIDRDGPICDFYFLPLIGKIDEFSR